MNDVVQKTIDRIIFLRVCEDRDIEQYGNLKDIVEEGSDIYERLMVYFGRAENRYNAGLFNLREDPHKTSPHIVIDDVVLSEIINSLYYPDSPYAFNAIPVEILGQVYERFLGKTIRLTPSGQAKIEYKPEVRKAGGIYYTPKYIVDYIVENTVGRILGGLDMKLSHPPGGKKPTQVRKIRILDPACGSGSFLLGAYDYLLRWYLERYIEDKDKYLDKTIYKVGDDDYRLMIDERKRILMEHIFGVDIDPQAVEVTKLSLHLKVLEGETGETLDGQLALIREPALPDLERNIRCGNSLIGPDFYKQFDIGLFDEDELRRINVFDWNDDEKGFGKIMRGGGGLSLWFVTFVTHNSRISERMTRYNINTGEPLIFSPEEQIIIAEKIAEACRKYNIKVVSWNILPDHVHMIISAKSEKELNEHIRRIKGYSSRAFNKVKGFDERRIVWAQKFNRRPIDGEEALTGIIDYVENNHNKHIERWGEEEDKGLDKATETGLDKGLKPLVQMESLVHDELLAKNSALAPREQLEPILKSLCVSVEDACEKMGGFDVVIGNPPYRKEREFKEEMKIYRNYENTKIFCEGKMDYWYLFLHKSLDISNYKSFISYIVPSYWLKSKGSSKVVKRLKNETNFIVVVDFNKNKIFEKSSGRHMIFVISKKTNNIESKGYYKFKDINLNSISLSNILNKLSDKKIDMINIDNKLIYIDDNSIDFNINENISVIEKLKQNTFNFQSEKNYFEVSQGIVEAPAFIDNKVAKKFNMMDSLGKGVFVISIKELENLNLNECEKLFVKPYLRIKDVSRYYHSYKNYFIFYISNSDNKLIMKEPIKYKNIINHLSKYKRVITSSNKPFGIHRTRNKKYFINPKIIGGNMFNVPEFTYCENEIYVNFSFNIIIKINYKYSLKYILGILNSKLGNFWFNKFGKKRGINVDIGVHVLRNFPIHAIDFNNPEDVAMHDEVVRLVERMMDLKLRYYETEDVRLRTQLDHAIKATDEQIDNLVYKLYNLTEEEIRIINNSMK